MLFTKNHFKKFLIDQLLKNKNVFIKDAVEEINDFSKTKEFFNSFEKWRSINLKNDKNIKKIKHISSIIKELFECRL